MYQSKEVMEGTEVKLLEPMILKASPFISFNL